MRLIRSGELTSRHRMGEYLESKGLTCGIEIGTHRGVYARCILEQWTSGWLGCVDPWSIPEGYEDQAKHLVESVDRDQDFAVANESLSEFIEAGRCELFRTTSEEHVRVVSDGTLDFVYLDGDHSFSGISQDLLLWWPKLKSGGLLCGHDIVMPFEPEPLWDVPIQKAVFGFCEIHQVDPYLIPEYDHQPWSFYMVKP